MTGFFFRIGFLLSFVITPYLISAQTSSEKQLAQAEGALNRFEFDSALLLYHQVQVKAISENNYTTALISLIGQVEIHAIKLEPKEANKCYEQVVLLQKQQPVANEIYEAYRAYGMSLVHYGVSDYYAALREIEKSHRLIQNYPQKFPILFRYKVLIYYARMLDMNYRPDVLENLEKATAYAKTNNLMQGYYWALNIRYTGLYYAFYNTLTALEYIEKEKAIYDKHLRPDNLIYADFYYNLGLIRKMMRQFSEAHYCLEKSEEIVNLSLKGNKNYLVYINWLIFDSYFEQGDYKNAIHYCNYTLDLLASDSINNIKLINTILISKANILLTFEEYKEAELVIDNLISLCKKIKLNEHIAYYMMAVVSKETGQLEKAKRYFSLAIKTTPEGSSYNAHYRSVYSEFLIQIQEGKAAIKPIKEALRLYTEWHGAKSWDVSRCYQILGNSYASVEQTNLALEAYQNALIAVIENFNDKNYLVNPNLKNERYHNYKISSDRYLIQALVTKGEFLLSLGRKATNTSEKEEKAKVALDCFEQSIVVIEHMCSYLSTDESRIFLNKYFQRSYTNALDAAMYLYRLTKNENYAQTAFKITEQTKASNLLAGIRGLEASGLGLIPDSISRQELDLISQITYFENLIREDTSLVETQNKKIWQQKIIGLQKKQQQITDLIKRLYPRYFNLKYNSSPISVTEVQAKIAPDQTLIEYAFSGSELFIFTIRKNEFKVNSIEVDSTFKSQINEYIRFCKQGGNGTFTPAQYQAYLANAACVYEKLVKPSLTLTRTKRLTIVPDGMLNYCSFEGLLTQRVSAKRPDFSKLPYLLCQQTLGYAYSATLQFQHSPDNYNNNGRILAFAPDYTLHANTNTAYTALNPSPIKGIDKEIKNISLYFATKIFSGEQASETNFKEQASQYAVLQLAMHAYVDGQNPMFSKLVFSPSNDTLNDGLLNAYEIYGMQLNAAMTVLSACNTGDGMLYENEGVMSLARAFIYTGCPSVVMSLWPVGDNSGTELMKLFYQNLKNGLPKDEALRQAKLSYLSSADPLSAHPFYWQNYILIGNTDVINIKPNLAVWYTAGTILLIAIISFMIYNRRKKS